MRLNFSGERKSIVLLAAMSIFLMCGCEDRPLPAPNVNVTISRPNRPPTTVIVQPPIVVVHPHNPSPTVIVAPSKPCPPSHPHHEDPAPKPSPPKHEPEHPREKPDHPRPHHE